MPEISQWVIGHRSWVVQAVQIVKVVQFVEIVKAVEIVNSSKREG